MVVVSEHNFQDSLGSIGRGDSVLWWWRSVREVSASENPEVCVAVIRNGRGAFTLLKSVNMTSLWSNFQGPRFWTYVFWVLHDKDHSEIYMTESWTLTLQFTNISSREAFNFSYRIMDNLETNKL